MAQGHVKGNRNERAVAALIQEWWRVHEPAVEFCRTPMSGGWATPALREHFKACGDLMTDSPTFPWCVEVKAREAWSWDTLLAGSKSPVWKWWEQAQRDAETAALQPMMWFRHNREPWAVMLRKAPAGVTYRFVTDLERGVLVYPAAALLAVEPKYLLRFST